MKERKNASIAKKFYEDNESICYVGVKTTGSQLWYRKCENPSFTNENHYVVVNRDEQKIVDWFNEGKLMMRNKYGETWYRNTYNQLHIDSSNYDYKRQTNTVWTYKIRHEQDNIVEEGGSISKSSIYNAVDSLEVGQTISITKVED